MIAETKKMATAQELSKAQIERSVKMQETLFLDKQDIVDMVNMYDKLGFSYVKSRDTKKVDGDVFKHAAYAYNYEFLHAALATGKIDADYLNYLIPHPKSKGSRSKSDKRKKVTQSYIVILLTTRDKTNWRTDSEFTSILEDLLAHGADINAISAEFTPLQEAVKNNDVYACSELLRCGADVHKACIDGGEAILFAKRYALIKMLFDNGADVFDKSNDGDGTLHQLEDPQSVDFLVGKGVDINGENEYGTTPLNTANSTEMILAYLKNGADINHRTKGGDGLIAEYSKAIHSSWLFGNNVEKHYMEMAKCLIKNGISKENIQQGIDYIKAYRYNVDENQENYLKLLQSSL